MPNTKTPKHEKQKAAAKFCHLALPSTIEKQLFCTRMLLFCFGLILSVVGSVPPGLISASVTHIAVFKGLGPALMVAAGAATGEFFQAWLAVAASDWLLAHPGVASGLETAAAAVFGGLALYFGFWAKTTAHHPEKIPQKGHFYFGQGVILSVFNLLAIPYWLAYCTWLKAQGWWEAGLGATLAFSIGVTLGTFGVLYGYAHLGRWAERHVGVIGYYANKILGIIFLTLFLKSIYGVASN